MYKQGWTTSTLPGMWLRDEAPPHLNKSTGSALLEHQRRRRNHFNHMNVDISRRWKSTLAQSDASLCSIALVMQNGTAQKRREPCGSLIGLRSDMFRNSADAA